MNRQAKRALSLCIAASIAILGRPAPAAESGEGTKSSNTQSNGTAFALKLFSEETTGKKSNVLISPFSAYFALDMVLNGAGGKTREQMATVLGTTGEQLDKLNQQNKECMESLNASSGVKLEVANALYADNASPFKRSFIELCQSKYSAEAHNEDFSKPDTVTIINKWCSDKTHGKITEILKSLSKNDKMVLLNAIYFKGSWKDKFVDTATEDDHFTMLSGEKSPVKMMHKNLHTGYFEGPDFNAVRLSYAGDKQRMYVFLPNSNVTLAAFQAEFTEANWNSWRNKFRSSSVVLSLPRFKIEFKTDLKNSLSSMGMQNAFSSKADFTQMTSEIVRIGYVLQKTYMEVNEEGTEAAAVTAVGMVRAAATRPSVPVTFRVDRPFVVALVDEPTNQILFLGTITKP